MAIAGMETAIPASPKSNAVIRAVEANIVKSARNRARVVLYSPGMVGFGHIRRNASIAQGILSSSLQPVIVMIAEAWQGRGPPPPPGGGWVAPPPPPQKGGGAAPPARPPPVRDEA